MKKKFDIVKLISFGGILLSLGANLMSNYAQQKEMDNTIDEKVEKALSKNK